MINYLLRLFSRKPELIPVNELKSKSGIFQLDFTKGWTVDNNSNGGIYDFYNSNLNGVLQISAYQNRNLSYEYDIHKEMEKWKRKYKQEIIELTHTNAIMYKVNYGNQKQYGWTIGNKNKIAFITYTTPEIDPTKLDYEFMEILNLLNSFQII